MLHLKFIIQIKYIRYLTHKPIYHTLHFSAVFTIQNKQCKINFIHDKINHGVNHESRNFKTLY